MTSSLISPILVSSIRSGMQRRNTAISPEPYYVTALHCQIEKTQCCQLALQCLLLSHFGIKSSSHSSQWIALTERQAGSPRGSVCFFFILHLEVNFFFHSRRCVWRSIEHFVFLSMKSKRLDTRLESQSKQ